MSIPQHVDDDEVTVISQGEYNFLILIGQEADDDQSIQEIQQNFDTALALFEASLQGRLN